MDHRVSHDLDLATAKRVTEAAWGAYSERFSEYSPTIEWLSDTKAKIGFSAKGFNIEGGFELSEGAIDMSLEVPFIMRPFKKKAIEIIEREIRKWIEKAKKGEV